MATSGGAPGISHYEKAQRMTKDPLEGLCLLDGSGMPQVSLRGAGGDV